MLNSIQVKLLLISQVAHFQLKHSAVKLIGCEGLENVNRLSGFEINVLKGQTMKIELLISTFKIEQRV